MSSVPILAAVLSTYACFGPHASAQLRSPESASGWIDRAPVTSRHWMVAAANPLAVDAGARMLKEGGSAADAAIAVQLVLGLVEPQSSGLGGGAVLLLHDARKNRLVAYDGRETAPAAATPDRFLRDGQPIAFHEAAIGGRSVGVPGTVRLLEAVHRRHGRLPWARLFEPAIELAERGFAVSPRLQMLAAGDAYLTQPRARDYFRGADGAPLGVGAILRNPAYAATLRSIAAEGADAFYRGPIAQDIIETANAFSANPGDLTQADLAGYRVKVREAICAPYRGFRVCGMPLPSSGGVSVLQMLKLLEFYDLGAMGPASFWSVHFISEAGRLAYADRGVYEADPDFYTPPGGLLDRGYLRERARLIRPDATLGTALPGAPPEHAGTPGKAGWGRDAAPEFSSTSHISIVDRYGDAVAMTSTIEDAFGSRLMTRGGFLLNNELTDFSLKPDDAQGRPVANRLQPGKRPRSSMSPTLVFDRRDGRLLMTLGSSGGAAIIHSTAKTLIGTLDWGLDAQRAIDLPNFANFNGPTLLEPGRFPPDTANALRARGHDVRPLAFVSGIQAIQRTPQGWFGGADPRREGVALGD
jgi:gamma-glutamyltranspeptidase/glutathione hydrolase